MEVVVADQSGEEVDRSYLEQAARIVLLSEKVPESSELSIVLVDIAKMRELNRKLRGIDAPTDVLALPLYAGRNEIDLDQTAPILLLGDVIICPEVAEEAAAEYEVPFREEMSRLLIHGILHLLGYDHELPEKAREMEGIEERLLAGLGSDRVG